MGKHISEDNIHSNQLKIKDGELKIIVKDTNDGKEYELTLNKGDIVWVDVT